MAKALEDQTLALEDSGPAAGVRLEPSPRWVRVSFAGQFVADSKRVMLMLEPKHTPVYYFPAQDVRNDVLMPSDHKTHSPVKGVASYWTVRVGARTAENAVWSYQDPPPGCPDITGYYAFYWDKMDAWYEEDDEVFVHPRDPYKRVDVLQSSRHVRVVVSGQTVAETHRPTLLFETGLPTRYYIPRLDVRLDLMRPTQTISRCPYKGKATYWSVQVGEAVAPDIAWSYEAPIPECPKIEHLICFLNERVDALYVDGELMPRPRTPWS